MIFNPFEISQLHESLQPSISLPWALPQLQDNILLVLLVIIFLMADLLAWHPKGVMIHQLAWLGDTRNARTFDASTAIYPWLKPILMCQYFLFFGLSLLSISDSEMAMHLARPSWPELRPMILCLAVPLLWSAVQQFLFNWFCHLFEIADGRIIMNRCFLATHIILAPISTLIFVSVLAGAIDLQVTQILLIGLFILSQVVFIFNGFRIFCNSFYTTLLIFAYLCTLEIAPLLVIYAKIAR